MMESLFRRVNPSKDSCVLSNFSLNEFALLAGTYKHMFNEQLRKPNADNNHIINYNLKLQNYVIVNSSIHMLSAGLTSFLVKTLFGGRITRTTTNYLGTRRGLYAEVFLYGFAFCYVLRRLNHQPRLNVNHLVNPRDFNGEVMMNVVLKYYPQKVNQELFRRTLMDKYEGQLLKMTTLESMMGGGHAAPYKLSE
jgi:hypothetical protein